MASWATCPLEHSSEQLLKINALLALAPAYDAPPSALRNPQEIARREKFQELKGARKELKFLEEQFSGQFLYKGGFEKQKATEQFFKNNAPQYGILHLAVHGIVDHEKPELSGLALEEDSSTVHDNFLYAYEIKQLELQKTQLVVLAACKTGDGQLQNGEGILSIGRSFMYAGVPSLLTTLWNLNDFTSPMIIEEFYRNLSNGMEKDEALQKAKTDYLKKVRGIDAHPQLWACFTQVGDYAAIKIEKRGAQALQAYMGYGIAGLAGLLLSLILVIRRKQALATREGKPN